MSSTKDMESFPLGSDSNGKEWHHHEADPQRFQDSKSFHPFIIKLKYLFCPSIVLAENYPGVYVANIKKYNKIYNKI